MKQCNVKASVDSIETFGLVDGPGIRTVIFFNGCGLRCKFCHNPEMWEIRDKNYTVDDLVKRVLRNKPYFKNGGGVTLSGGEPLLQQEFLLELCKCLKNEGIHIALDTALIVNNLNFDLFNYVDLVLLDIKHINKEGYQDITGFNYLDMYLDYVSKLNNYNVDIWIRQVIIPGVNDNKEYIYDLSDFIHKYINNVKRIDFLPFHTLGKEKYIKLNINNPYEDKDDMDKELCNELYKEFINYYENSSTNV